MYDGNGRKIDYLRLSLTDRCNLRCQYCMPTSGVALLHHDDILRYDEILRLCSIFASMGLRKVKLTGGEPLVRKGLVPFIQELNAIDGIERVTLTTNGTLLKDQLHSIYEAGISSINISLDSLNAQRYQEVTRGGSLSDVLDSIHACAQYPIHLKINCVALESSPNDILDMVSFARDYPIHVRFIELMPIGYGSAFVGIAQDEILAILESSFGSSQPSLAVHGNGPAQYVDFAGFKGSVGFISAVSHQFCDQCNRIRLTADGDLKLCLHYDQGISLKRLLRNGASDQAIHDEIQLALNNKPKEHAFFSAGAIEDIDPRGMSQIGG